MPAPAGNEGKPTTPPGPNDPGFVAPPGGGGLWYWNPNNNTWEWQDSGTVTGNLTGSGVNIGATLPGLTTSSGANLSPGNISTDIASSIQATYDYHQANPNPNGDQYNTNLQYQPFGLSPSRTPGPYGGGASQGAFLSDQLVPSLEQVRMQRLLQAYSPNYGGGGRY